MKKPGLFPEPGLLVLKGRLYYWSVPSSAALIMFSLAEM